MGNSLVMTRKALAGVATVAILASQLVVAPMARAAETKFSDVPSNEWYAEYVAKLTEMKVIEGYSDGTYKPNNSVNRAEMSKIATMLAKETGVIADTNDIVGSPTFSDVPADQWYYGYVSVLAKNKILEGYRDASGNLTGRFGPGDFVNRAEASKILLLAAGIPSKLTPATPFVDVNPSDWFYEYVTSAYNWSILDGYKLADNKTLTGYFGPGDQVTRAQIAKIAVLAQNPVERNSENSNENNANQNMTNGNTNAVSKVSFEAAMSSQTPASKILAGGTAYNDVLKLDLTAGNDEDVKVTEITVNHLGNSKSADITGVLVVDRDGVRHGSIITFSDGKATINLGTNPIVVAAGTTHTVTVQVNFSAAIATAGSFKAEVPANGIKGLGAKSNGTVAVKGTFPITGPEYQLLPGNNIGKIEVTSGTGIGTSLDLGVTKKPVSSFKLAEMSSNEEVALTELTVYNNGTSADGDVKNLTLVSNGEELAMVEQTTNRYARFVLNKPLTLTKGGTKTLDIQVDVVNGSSRTIQFLIMNDYDLKVSGLTSKAFLLPTTTGNFPVGEVANTTSTINEGSLILSRATTSPSGEIANGIDDTVVAEYKVEAFGEDIEIQGGTLGLVDNDMGGVAYTNPALPAVTNNPFTGSIRLMNASGSTIHSVSATDFNGNAALTVQTFNSPYTVKAGTTATLRIVGNVKEAAVNGTEVLASLGNLRIKKVASNKYQTLGNTAAGNGLVVSKANVIVSKNTATASESIVAGGSNQLIGAFDVKATNTGDVRVTNINLSVAGNTNITNLRLRKATDGKEGALLGSPVANPAATNNTFSVSGSLNVTKGTTVTVNVYADVTTNAAGNIEVTIPANGISGNAQGADVTAPALAATLQTYTTTASGNVAVALTNNVSNSRVVTAGASNEAIMSFSIKAEDKEAMRLNKLTVEINGAMNAPASVQSVVLMRNGQAIAPATSLLLSGGDYTVEFTGLNQEIARNQTAQFSVAVNLVNSNAFVAGGVITASVTAFEVTGVASGQLVVSTSYDHDNNPGTAPIAWAGINGTVNLTLQKVTPTIAPQGVDRNDVPGTETNVASFKVVASGTEDMVIDEINFNVAGAKAAVITNVRLYVLQGNQEVLIASPVANEAAGVVTVNPTGGYKISAGSEAIFVVKANTSGVKGALDNASLKLSIAANQLEYTYMSNGAPVNATAPTSTVEFSTIRF